MSSAARLDPAKRARLKTIFAEKAILKGGNFTLASGGQTSVFFDMKMALLEAEGLSLVADLMLQTIGDEKVDAVGGLVLGACPIVDALVLKSYPARNLTGFSVSKEPKARGTNNLI